VLATLLVALVAIIHLAILVLEMFLGKPAGRRAFNLSADFARETRVLAANQGLYNGFWPPAWHGGCGWGRRGCRWLSFSWPACWPPGFSAR
jgi:putative membrane protein